MDNLVEQVRQLRAAQRLYNMTKEDELLKVISTIGKRIDKLIEKQ